MLRLSILSLLVLITTSSYASSNTQFDKTNQALTITVINYDDRNALLKVYNSYQTKTNQYRNEDTIDGFTLYSVEGTVATIHVYRDKRTKTYQNTLGHELQHVLEGTFH